MKIFIGIGTGRCFDTQTEVLTNNGWKNIDTISKNDLALGLNPETGEASYYKINEILKYDVDEFLNVLEGRRVNFAFTDDHNYYFRDGYSKQWKIRKFKDVPRISYIKRTFIWKGKEPKYFILEPIERKKYDHVSSCDTSKKIKIEDWLEFLGWFLSEGNIFFPYKGNYRIKITQTKDKYKKEIEDLLKRLRINFYYSQDGFYFQNKQLWYYLSENCYNSKIKKCYTKKVPDFIKELSPRLIKIFLLAFAKGDGYFRENNKIVFITTSLNLANDLQELILKSGGYATLSEVKNLVGKKHLTKRGWITNKKTIYRIYYIPDEKDGYIDKRYIKRIKYKGKVWCINIDSPYHLIYIRRKGRCMWTGNCGTMSLAKLIDGCNGCKVFHEYDAPRSILSWDFNEQEAMKKAKQLINLKKEYGEKGINLIGDVALYYLNYIEYFDSLFDNLKIIHIWNDREKVISSFIKKVSLNNIKKNHWWSDRKKINYGYVSDIWDKAFPKFDNTETIEEAIGKYWDLYMSTVKNLKTKEPIFELYVYDLNKKEVQKEIFDYLEIPEKDRKYGYYWENKLPNE